MTEKPALDPELHEDDTLTSVWKRRMVLVLLIVLVVAVAAPTFGGCSGFFSTKKTAATFEVAGRTISVDDEQLGQFTLRYMSAMRMLGIDPAVGEGEDVSKGILRRMMLDALAKAEGVHVPDSQVTEIIRSRPQFQVGGKFDEGRYRAEMSNFSRGGLNHHYVSEMLRVRIRSDEYEQLGATAYQVIPGGEAYDAWKKRSVKLTVDYVAVPYEAQRERIASIQPSEDDLQKIAGLPAVKALLAVPPRKTIEVAILKVEEMDAERFAAAKKFAEDAEIFSEERPLEAEAFVQFHGDRDYVFTKEHWGRLKDPEYPAKRRKYDEDHLAWEKQPKESRGEEPKEPADPKAGYPEEERAQFPLWRERVEKEILARHIVKDLVTKAEREGKALSEVAADYARFGVRVVKNAEPLSDTEIVEKFPDPVARDSEFDQVAIVGFRAPAEGAVFKRQYHSQPVPTTRLADRIGDRGYMVASLESCDAARQYTLAERAEQVVDFWHKHQVVEAAKSVAEEIRKKAEAAQPDAAKVAEALRAAAAEAKLEVQTLRRFNRSTESPRVPVAAAGETLSPEVQAIARRIALRNRVQQDYQLLSGLDVGKVRDPVLVDEKLEAAFVVVVTEKYEPRPVEMRDEELRSDRYGLAIQAKSKIDQVFAYEELAKTLNLKRFDEKAKPAADEPKKQ